MPDQPARRRRFVYNCDADNLFLYADPPMQPQDVRTQIDAFCGTGLTTLFMCPNYGMAPNFPSSVTPMFGTAVSAELAATLDPPGGTRSYTMERAAVNLASLVAAGHDPLGLVIDHARARGLETFITFRLNEVHCVEEPDSLLFCPFWREHPEWRIGCAGDPLPQVHLDILGPNTHPIVASWLPAGLDFAIPEVRAYRLAELRECCERFAVDGIDLDFQRFPMYFRPGEEEQGVATMTAWMREVRAMTRAAAAARGRDIPLSVRVMARPEQNRAIGIDPIAWAHEGLVDIVVASHYLRNDFPLPVAEYRSLLPPEVPLIASIEIEREPDTYRRMARDLWSGGADGIMLFNFFAAREAGKEPPVHLFNELGDPARIREDGA